MDDYISYAINEFEYKGLTIRQWADKITSGEYQPVKHGRWRNWGRDNEWVKFYRCSECNFEVADCAEDLTTKYNYCPNCGCKQDL